MAVTKLERAKVQLVISHPFFARILMERPLIEDRTIPTAGVDQRGQVYYNPDFVDSLTVDQIVFLLAHETMHVVWQHAARKAHRDGRRWNIAADAVINDTLRDSKVGAWIDCGVDMPGSKEKTADQVYNELPDNPTGSGKGKGKGQGQNGQGNPGDGDYGIGDDLLERGAPITAEEAERISGEIKVLVAQAAQVAKMQGKMPGALGKLVADLIESKVPWHQILERYMTDMSRGDYSWARPNRRFLATAYLPSTGFLPEMGEVVLQIDVSGSVSKQEIDHYNGHIARIVGMCRPKKVHVLYCDTHVQKHVEFDQDEEVAIEFYSGGGTDMEEGFNYIAKHGLDPEVFVCLTDGYTGFNQANAPDYPVIWCISTQQVAPYGENIHFELERV